MNSSWICSARKPYKQKKDYTPLHALPLFTFKVVNVRNALDHKLDKKLQKQAPMCQWPSKLQNWFIITLAMWETLVWCHVVGLKGGVVDREVAIFAYDSIALETWLIKLSKVTELL